MAVNVQKYAKRLEELQKQGKSVAEAHAQATKEASQKEGGTVAKKKRSKLYELWMGKGAYGAAAANRKIKAELRDKNNLATKSVIESGKNRYGEDLSYMTDTAKAKKKRKTVLTGRK